VIFLIKSQITQCNSKELTMAAERFEDSPEHEDWIQETGGSDEAYSRYYQKWERRVRNKK
jgi:hypothetical protein